MPLKTNWEMQRDEVKWKPARRWWMAWRELIIALIVCAFLAWLVGPPPGGWPW